MRRSQMFGKRRGGGGYIVVTEKNINGCERAGRGTFILRAM